MDRSGSKPRSRSRQSSLALEASKLNPLPSNLGPDDHRGTIRPFARSQAAGWRVLALGLPLLLGWRLDNPLPGTVAAQEAGRLLPNPFFAFDNGLMDQAHQSLAAKAQTLAKLGYDGIGWRPGQVRAMRAELEQRGLRLFTLYTGLRLEAKEAPWDPRLPQILPQLRGAGTVIWLTVTSRSFSPSDPAGDPAATLLIRSLAAIADAQGLQVALYPHHGFWIQTTEDALRVATKVDRPNVGVSFNLCHCLRAGNGPRIPEILQRAAPRLFLVSINGADRQGNDWERLIQPLDRGDLDLLPLLRQLQELRYQEPIGLQCYGIDEPAEDHLARSIAAWRRYRRRLAALAVEPPHSRADRAALSTPKTKSE